MILIKILDHDLHRSKQKETIPVWIEVPARNSFLPSVISSSRGKFIISRKLLKPVNGIGLLRVGVFKCDSDRLDDLIDDMCKAAIDLSISEKWGNIFTGRGAILKAFNYVKKNSGTNSQPHACLIPDTLDQENLNKLFGKKNLDEQNSKYMKMCRLIPCKIKSGPVFLSRPDFVGMYTQFMGGGSSIILHNVKLGMGFCN